MKKYIIILAFLTSCSTSANEDIYFVTYSESIASLSGSYKQIYWSEMNHKINANKAEIGGYWYFISFDQKNRIIISGDWYLRDIENGSIIIFK